MKKIYSMHKSRTIGALIGGLLIFAIVLLYHEEIDTFGHSQLVACQGVLVNKKYIAAHSERVPGKPLPLEIEDTWNLSFKIDNHILNKNVNMFTYWHYAIGDTAHIECAKGVISSCLYVNRLYR